MIKYPHTYWVVSVDEMPGAECNSWGYASAMITAHVNHGRDVTITEYTIKAEGEKPVKGKITTRKGKRR